MTPFSRFNSGFRCIFLGHPVPESPGYRLLCKVIVLTAERRIEEAEREERTAVLEGYPDFDLRLGYRIRRDVEGDPVKGDDFFSAGVTLRLPVDRGRWRGWP